MIEFFGMYSKCFALASLARETKGLGYAHAFKHR
jgi:hypothetical protein